MTQYLRTLLVVGLAVMVRCDRGSEPTDSGAAVSVEESSDPMVAALESASHKQSDATRPDPRGPGTRNALQKLVEGTSVPHADLPPALDADPGDDAGVKLSNPNVTGRERSLHPRQGLGALPSLVPEPLTCQPGRAGGWSHDGSEGGVGLLMMSGPE